MIVTEKVVRHVAALAQLDVTPTDVSALQAGMQGILDLAEQIRSTDTSGTPPLANPLDQVQRLRPDEVTEGDQRELFQSIAPATAQGLYLVPRVVE